MPVDKTIHTESASLDSRATWRLIVYCNIVTVLYHIDY